MASQPRHAGDFTEWGGRTDRCARVDRSQPTEPVATEWRLRLAIVRQFVANTRQRAQYVSSEGRGDRYEWGNL